MTTTPAPHSTPLRPAPNRFQRRIISLPLLALLDVGVVLLSPLLFVLALIADLVSGIRRRRFLRILGLAMGVLAVETAGVIIAGVLWVATGFGLLNKTRTNQRALARLQAWYTTALLNVVGRTCSTSFSIEGLDDARPGRIIVAARHVSHGDALLPSHFLGTHAGLSIRYVLKRQLAWGPSIDLVGHRTRNHFIERGAASAADLDALADTARSMHTDDAVVIFPEGTFFSPERKARAIARLSENEPALAERAEHLQHLLPPRPRGLLALLRGAPDADLVFMTHVGFEPFDSVGNILRNIPFPGPVSVRMWRVPRSEVPEDPEKQLLFVFDWWQRLDNWVTEHQQSNP